MSEIMTAAELPLKKPGRQWLYDMQGKDQVPPFLMFFYIVVFVNNNMP